MKNNKEYKKVKTTGHKWDGIEELDNPIPRWILVPLYLCIAFAIGYWILYPSWPTSGGNSKGLLGWSSHKQLKEGQAELLAIQSKYIARLENSSLEEIVADKELKVFAIAGGKSAFKTNCITCHGEEAEGNKEYPSLIDDDWLWEGSLNNIYDTITYGIRADHDETQESHMPAFGAMFEKEKISKLAKYVMALSSRNSSSTQSDIADVFAESCAMCHGENGEGVHMFGAPRLNDTIWLYGGDIDSIIETITNSRNGVMPAWEGRLSETTIKQLTVYIHYIGGSVE